MGLLYGNGDIERTLEVSTRCGQDADCNPSSAMAVLGVMSWVARRNVKHDDEAAVNDAHDAHAGEKRHD